VTYRVVVAGAELRMLVLAGGHRETVGVDLATGALVRAGHPGAAPPPATFDVVAAEIAGSAEPPDDARPEAVELTAAPRRVGRMGRHRARRRLSHLAHPRRVPVLGLATDAVPYWTLAGDRPSVALLEVATPPELRWGPSGLECAFRWAASDHELPLTPEAAERLLAGLEAASGDLTRVLGYWPRRLLVVLSAPVEGYCQKAVAALLP